MTQLRHQKPAFDSRNAAVLIVSFESGLAIRRYAHDPDLPGPVLSDPERTLYGAYGMLRASTLDVWGPATWWAYARAMAIGLRPRASDADANQRGGNVLIDPAGVVRLHHVGRGPADRPSVESILSVMHLRGSK